MPAERRQLRIDVDEARWLRPQLGPLTWSVLEVLVSQIEPGARPTVVCSSRSLAELVGVSKDSVARALRCLIDENLVCRVDHRDGESGRFLGSSYVIDVDTVGLSVATVSQNSAPTPSERPPPVARAPWDQLSLLTSTDSASPSRHPSEPTDPSPHRPFISHPNP